MTDDLEATLRQRAYKAPYATNSAQGRLDEPLDAALFRELVAVVEAARDLRNRARFLAVEAERWAEEDGELAYVLGGCLDSATDADKALADLDAKLQPEHKETG